MFKRTFQSKFFRIAALPALMLSVAACDDDPTDPMVTENIIEVVQATGDVSTLGTAVAAANLTAALQADGPFTVFAPRNAAFDALGEDVLDVLLDPDNVDLLSEILTFHVVPDVAAFSDGLSDGQMVTTLQGEMLTIGVSANGVSVNGASVVTADIETTNGVIHLIDAVLLPELDVVERAMVTSETQTLAAAVAAADLGATLQGPGPFTVFAPVNAAFDALGMGLDALLEEGNQALLQDILTYHVVAGDVRAGDLTDGMMATTVEGSDVTFDLSGTTPMVNGAAIIATDIVVGNGVIHLIDGVLTPELDIVERAIITDETQTLVSAVVAGDLVATLQGPGPFTVLAPINAAFDDLGEDMLNVLLDADNQALLQKILTYHVIPGDVRAGDLTDGMMAETVEGSEVTFDLTGAVPMVNGASIIATDIVVGNGVIHLIDGVLTENADIVDVALLNGFPTLVDLVIEADLEATLRGDNMGDGYTVFAPTEAAFAALASVPTGQALVDILTYHVVAGTVGSGDLTDGQVVTTVEGTTFTVNIDGSDVTLTDGSGAMVSVVLTDVPAANGVVHVIDAVLMPS